MVVEVAQKRLGRSAEAIADAEDAVQEAQRAYSAGRGSCEAVNRANRKLADAWNDYREVSGGNVRDTRR